MALIPYRPFGLIDQLRREMDQVFGAEPAEPGMELAEWTPAVDIVEHDDAYEITADVPGIEPDKLEVTCENGVLRISGEKCAASEKKNGGYHRIERSYGRFARSFRLPDSADLANVKAKSKNGVLKLTVPKTKESKARRIPIS